jgi:hypothetical protein
VHNQQLDGISKIEQGWAVTTTASRYSLEVTSVTCAQHHHMDGISKIGREAGQSQHKASLYSSMITFVTCAQVR